MISGVSSVNRRDARYVGTVDPLCFRDVADRAVHAVIKLSLPPPCPRRRFDERAIRLRFRVRHDFAAVRGDNALAAAAALETRAVSIAGALPASLLSAAAVGERDGRTAMAKGQKRSNREAKKPKADKKKTLASAGTVPSALAKPQPGGAKTETKK